MVSFVKMEWRWLDHNVAKENLWTSVSLACIALLVEFFYSHRHEYKRQSPKIYATSASPLYFDSPTSSDLFNRKSYAKLLLNKIYSSFCSKERNKHSFVIHIGEHYGQGKTSFLMMLEEEIKSRKVPVVNIHFEPWLCDSEAGIINEFFDTFRIEVGKYLPRLNGTMQQYVRLLLSSIKYESRWLTVSLASLFGCKSTLKTTHDLIRDELMKIDCPIIITIDDVDRLQGKELMMVLKIIRDTADFPNVFYIVAADNIHLKRMLKSLNINNPDEYLKKFFNLEFQLPANEDVAFGELLKLLEGKYQDLGIDEKMSAWYVWQIRNVAYIKEAFPNMTIVR